MSREPGLPGISSSDGSGLEVDPAKALMPPSPRAGFPVWTNPVTPQTAWLPPFQLLQLEEVESQGRCHGLWTPLLPFRAAGNHPCSPATYCSASLHIPSPIWHGAWIPRNQFSLGVPKGMWDIGAGVAECCWVSRETLGELRIWRGNRASQPWDPDSLKGVSNTATADCRASMKEAASSSPTNCCATEILWRKFSFLLSATAP